MKNQSKVSYLYFLSSKSQTDDEKNVVKTRLLTHVLLTMTH